MDLERIDHSVLAAGIRPSAIAPQAVGNPGQLIPFPAATHDVIFDAFTADTWTPAAATVNLFNGSLGQVRPYGYLAALWLKVTTAGGTAGAGVLAADAPLNALQTFRFLDPNGHAVIDCDGYGLFLLNKYGARFYLTDPAKMPNASLASVVGFKFELLVPLIVNPELGIGAIPNMDASGPYRIQAVGNTTGALHSTPPTAESVVTVAVGGEFLTLPDSHSRVNGAPQMIAPPGLDRGFAIVAEYTKQVFAIQSGGGNQLFRLTRVGNIIRQLFLVLRNSAGARIDWVTSLTAGSLIQFAFDTVPLWQADPQHVLDQMARRRSGSIAFDTGVLIVDFAAPSEFALGSLGENAGFDNMLQTAQSSALEITLNTIAGAGNGSLEIYTQDITITSLTGQPYSFAYAGQLLAPTPPGQIRS